MIVALIVLWILPGLDKIRLYEWYQHIPELWRRILTIVFDIFFQPIGIVLDLIKEFGKLKTSKND